MNDLFVRGFENPLHLFNEKREVYTVRYEDVNAILLNEFLKEHREVKEQDYKGPEQEARLTKQEATIAQQQIEIKALTAKVY